MKKDKRNPVTTPERSRIMSAIRAKNTKPELTVRRYLHHAGLRYSLHNKKLPGTPDLVFSRYKVALFVNGCFWHGHNACQKRMPKSNAVFWSDKIKKNIERDTKKIAALNALGWRVITIWECNLTNSKLYELLLEIKREH